CRAAQCKSLLEQNAVFLREAASVLKWPPSANFSYRIRGFSRFRPAHPFIIDQQVGFAFPDRDLQKRRFRAGLARRGVTWEKDVKARSTTDLAGTVHPAFVLSDDAENRR